MNGCTAFSVSPDGLSVWAFHSASNELRQYALEGDK
jgi:hypothetical protein